MQNQPARFVLGMLALGWLADYLLWGKTPGVSLAVYVAVLVVGGVVALRMEGKALARRSALLILPIGFFAIFSFIRQEAMSRFLAFVFTLGLLMLLATTATGGRWLLYGVRDYIGKPLELLASILGRGAVFLGEMRRQPRAAAADGAAPTRSLGPVVRGVLLALPVLGVFLALLASADLIFAQRLRTISAVFDIERIPEYGFRLVLILIAAYCLAGVYLHAARHSDNEKLIGLDRPALGWLGFTEATIVLGSVVALFAVFVVFQLQYFFSGAANVTLDGFTYAEYARRGFGELVAVAVVSLLLFLGLSALARRERMLQRWVFSGLGIGLTALVGLILASAFQRLLLYEAAYGFSRLRTYPHVFMIWLGLLLAATAALEIAQRQRLFTAAALLAAIGFAATLNVMNVDAFIARQNVLRAAQGQELDVAYLGALSLDAAPALVQLYQSEALPEATQDAAGAALVCMAERVQRTAAAEDQPNVQPAAALPWQSFHVGKWQGQRWLAAVEGQLAGYHFEENEDGSMRLEGVTTPLGEQYTCQQWREYYD